MRKSVNFISIDPGSSKVAVVGAYIRGDTIGVNILKLYHSDGVLCGSVVDLRRAEESVSHAIYSVEKLCNKSIKEVFVVLSGGGTCSHYVKKSFKIRGKKVTSDDILSATNSIVDDFKHKGEDVLHYFPIEFMLDGNLVQDPVGMMGSEIVCNIHVVTIKTNLLLNITNCFHGCRVEVSGVVLGVYGASTICLTADEKKLGALFIDFGARTTSFCVVVDDKLVYTNYIPVGSWNITYDIAKIFSIGIEASEKLKVLYGNACVSESRDLVELENEELPHITMHDLSVVISARVEEIFGLVIEEYEKFGVECSVGDVVITGGGALLHNLNEFLRPFFKNVRIAEPYGIERDANGGGCFYSSAIGAVYLEHARRAKTKKGGVFSKFFRWMKESI